MTSCCPPPPMPWNGATGAIARCKRVSTGCGRKSRSVRALHWICGVKRKPKAVNKPWHHCIVHGLDKPGVFTTVSNNVDRVTQLQASFDRVISESHEDFEMLHIAEILARAQTGLENIQDA